MARPSTWRKPRAQQILAARRLRDPPPAERGWSAFGLRGCRKPGRGAGGCAPALSPVFLLLTPNYYGQMFNNYDILFAVGSSATAVMVRIPAISRARDGGCSSRWAGGRFGAWGSAAATLFFCYLGLLLVSALWQGWRRSLAALVAAGRGACVCAAAGRRGGVAVMLAGSGHTVDLIGHLLHARFFLHEIFLFDMVRRSLRPGRRPALGIPADLHPVGNGLNCAGVAGLPRARHGRTAASMRRQGDHPRAARLHDRPWPTRSRSRPSCSTGMRHFILSCR